MTKTLPYNSANIKKIYNNLVTLNNQGVAKDFEIRIDDLTVVHRTNDVGKFYLMRKSITNYSSEINIILYKGKARRYDKFVFYINNNQSPDPTISADEYIEKKINEQLAIEKKEYEFKRLKEDNQTQKQLIIELKKENQELKSKTKGDLKEILQLIGTQFKTPAPQSKDLDGIPSDDLIQMIEGARKKFGDTVFKDIMGIALITGENPTIIKEVTEFINSKIQEKNENNKGKYKQ